MREVVIRPFLHELGYKAGTRANIRTEVSLKYSKAFLGRKNPDKDPDLRGRADYVCEVIPFARWTVEAKTPQKPIDQEDVQQAHTYAAHPEIGADLFLLANGLEFRVYRTGRLESPALQWNADETASKRLAIENVLGPEAIRRRAEMVEIDANQPLAAGLRSTAKIVGGYVACDVVETGDREFDRYIAAQGLMLAVTGTDIFRVGNLIRLRQATRSSNPYAARALRKLGIENWEYDSADSIISSDRNHPTIFQGHHEKVLPAGLPIGPGRHDSDVTLPFPIETRAVTRMAAFLSDSRLNGAFEVTGTHSPDLSGKVSRHARRVAKARVIPSKLRVAGTFEFVVQ